VHVRYDGTETRNSSFVLHVDYVYDGMETRSVVTWSIDREVVKLKLKLILKFI